MSTMINLLERISLALNDWVVTYASEMCGNDDVSETRKRIMENGGTLAYISSLQQEVVGALVNAQQASQQKPHTEASQDTAMEEKAQTTEPQANL